MQKFKQVQQTVMCFHLNIIILQTHTSKDSTFSIVCFRESAMHAYIYKLVQHFEQD